MLRAFGGVLLAVAALSVFIALWNAVRERRFDLAMLRMLGAPPGPRGRAGAVRSAVAGGPGLCPRACCWATAWRMPWAGRCRAQGLLPVTGAGAGCRKRPVCRCWRAWWAALAALLPAMQAYRTDVADLLVQP